MLSCFVDSSSSAIALHAVKVEQLDEWLQQQSSCCQAWASQTKRLVLAGDSCVFPNEKGQLELAVVLIDARNPVEAIAAAASSLPEQAYALHAELSDQQWEQVCVAWGLACYQFNAYRCQVKTLPMLVWPSNVDKDAIEQQLTSYYLVQDLINTPTEDMGPAELAEAVCFVADEFGADVNVCIGEQLLADNYPMIYAVGRGSPNQPRLIDLRWQSTKPVERSITLVGKGVCYDTGGLSIKPTSSMMLMRKDMGGSAHALGLARLIMAADLPVKLRLLIPAVENALDGASYRPGDILTARDGTTVEIGNTDAEGRLVLADALVEAASEKPDLLMDFATLTGAARVALGPEVHAMMTNDDDLAAALMASGLQVNDVLWQLPLYQPYKRFLKSQMADCNNVNTSGVGQAGAITAGLFLQQFVADQKPWVHMDIFGWNADERPGKPYGASVTGIRAVWHYLSCSF